MRSQPPTHPRRTHARGTQADLLDPTSLPATLVGVSAVIDCATARPEESTQKIDWEGKVALIQCAQVWALRACLCVCACVCVGGGGGGGF
jgi:hypothetical protein